MQLKIDEKHKQTINDLIKNGYFKSEDDILNCAINDLKEKFEQAIFVKKAVLEGIEEIERGEYKTYNNYDELKADFLEGLD